MEELNLANALAGMQKSPCLKRSAKIDNLIENQALGQKKIPVKRPGFNEARMSYSPSARFLYSIAFSEFPRLLCNWNKMFNTALSSGFEVMYFSSGPTAR